MDEIARMLERELDGLQPRPIPLAQLDLLRKRRQRARRVGAALTALVVAIAAIGTAIYMLRGMTGTIPAGPPALSSILQFPTHSRSVVVLDDAVFIGGTESRHLQHLDLDGQNAWTLPEARAVTASDNMVYAVGTEMPAQIGTLAAYQPDGTRLWRVTYGVDGNETVANAVAVEGDAIYVVGRTDVSIGGQQYPGDLTDAFLARFDLSGTLIWAREIGWPSAIEGVNVDAEAVAVTSDGVVMAWDAVGATSGTPSFVKSFTPDGDSVSEFDPGINVTSLATNPLGGYYVAGTSRSSVVLSSRSATGQEIWSHEVPSDGFFSLPNGPGVVADESGAYFAGSTTQPDAFMIGYSHDGRELWQTSFGTSQPDWPFGITISGRNIYIVGITDGTFPGQERQGDESGFVGRLELG
jgi:outer membrane protein assembly factor BamB